MHHFFVTPSQIEENYIVITGQDVNHIRNVLRMKEGEQVGIQDGISRNYVCEITMMTGEEVRAKILSVKEEEKELPTKIYLFQGLPKSDKMELIIQKAVELGVYQIIPVATKRAVVKLDQKKEATKVKRWNAISESAAKQSGRQRIPEITGVMTLKQAFSYAAEFDKNVIPYELATGMEDTKQVFAQITAGMQVGIFIGPEGGFELEEIEAAKAANIYPITLGKRILRTETAGLAVLSVLMFQLEQD